MRTLIGTAAAAVLTLTLGCASGQNRTDTLSSGLSLEGSWVLNEAESERADSALQATVVVDSSAYPSRGTVFGAPRTGREGTVDPRSPQERAVDIQGARLAFAAAMRPLERFTLVRGPEAVIFRFGGKNAIRLETDGRAQSERWPGIGESRVSARWVPEGLRIERQVPGAPTVAETYTSSEDASRLIVTVETVNASYGNVSIRRIYDRG